MIFYSEYNSKICLYGSISIRKTHILTYSTFPVRTIITNLFIGQDAVNEKQFQVMCKLL